MDFLAKHYALIMVLIVIGFVLSALGAILEAYLETKKRPREEMLWCNRHGYYRKEHGLPLFPHMASETLVCPQCYKTAVYDNVQVKG